MDTLWQSLTDEVCAEHDRTTFRLATYIYSLLIPLTQAGTPPRALPGRDIAMTSFSPANGQIYRPPLDDSDRVYDQKQLKKRYTQLALRREKIDAYSEVCVPVFHSKLVAGMPTATSRHMYMRPWNRNGVPLN